LAEVRIVTTLRRKCEEIHAAIAAYEGRGAQAKAVGHEIIRTLCQRVLLGDAGGWKNVRVVHRGADRCSVAGFCSIGFPVNVMVIPPYLKALPDTRPIYGTSMSNGGFVAIGFKGSGAEKVISVVHKMDVI